LFVLQRWNRKKRREFIAPFTRNGPQQQTRATKMRDPFRLDTTCGPMVKLVPQISPRLGRSIHLQYVDKIGLFFYKKISVKFGTLMKYSNFLGHEFNDFFSK
jgi:hypothetical protein